MEALLRLIDAKFDVFVTSDQGILHQQNLSGGHIAILQLPTNKLAELLSLSALIVQELAALRPGDFRILTRRPGVSG